MKKLAFPIFVILSFYSCSINPARENSVKQEEKKVAANMDDQADMQTITDKDYKIEKNESNDVLVKLFVYIPDTLKLKSINLFLMRKYNDDKKKWYNVFYFNKKDAINQYLKSIDDADISNEKWEKKYSKNSDEFCIVDFNPNTGEEYFEYHR